MTLAAQLRALKAAQAVLPHMRDEDAELYVSRLLDGFQALLETGAAARNERRAFVCWLADQGLSANAIAGYTGVPRRTVRRYLAERLERPDGYKGEWNGKH